MACLLSISLLFSTVYSFKLSQLTAIKEDFNTIVNGTLDQEKEKFEESVFNSFLSQLQQGSTNQSSDQPGSGSELEGLALKISDFLHHKGVFVLFGAIITVIGCCLVSQCVVRVSKNYRLHLNKYYQKKRYEKAKMIQQYLNEQEEEMDRRKNNQQREVTGTDDDAISFTPHSHSTEGGNNHQRSGSDSVRGNTNALQNQNKEKRRVKSISNF